MTRFVVWGFLTAGGWTSPALCQQQTGEERLLGADIEPAGITFRVPSGGCTSKASFGLETIALTPLTVRLVRLRPDYCEANLPKGALVTFTYAEIGQPLTLPPQVLHSIVIVNNHTH